MNIRSSPHVAKGYATSAATAARAGESGFTLLEALVAMAILAVVLASFLGMRTTALVDASLARNYRIARELAERQLSELRAGARELPPESGVVNDFENFPGFRYKFLIGADHISDHEASEASQASASGDFEQSNRLAWQRDRDDQRLARQKGLDVNAFREQRYEEDEKRDTEPPADDVFEDVAVVIYFPDPRLDDPSNTGETSYMLKARVSTLAISGMTPEQAALAAAESGENTGGAGLPGGLGAPTSGGMDR